MEGARTAHGQQQACIIHTATSSIVWLTANRPKTQKLTRAKDTCEAPPGLTLQGLLAQGGWLGVVGAEVRSVCRAQGLALLGAGAGVAAAVHLELIDI